MLHGLVIKSTGSWYTVQHAGGKTKCGIKGKFRIKGIQTTNPIAIGDRVGFIMNEDNQNGVITTIEKRKNYIIRKSINLAKKYHIIAANIDQAFLIVSLANPRTNTIFIDRFLVTAEIYKIPTNIVFNKIDLYDDALKAELKTLQSIYENAGYKCYETSATEDINIEQIRDLMKHKINVFSGNSGVGKSTLINAIDPDMELVTGDISDYHKQGMHTTAHSEMFEIETGGSIIDTPGIKGFGIIDMDKEDISHNFPEMFNYLGKCQYYNCTHSHEPNCAVKQAVIDGEISEMRYRNYLSILNNEDDKYRLDAFR